LNCIDFRSFKVCTFEKDKEKEKKKKKEKSKIE